MTWLKNLTLIIKTILNIFVNMISLDLMFNKLIFKNFRLFFYRVFVKFLKRAIRTQ